LSRYQLAPKKKVKIMSKKKEVKKEEMKKPAAKKPAAKKFEEEWEEKEEW